MEVNVTNSFYESAVNHMVTQLNYLEKLIGRKLTPDEKDNLHEFYSSLDSNIKYKFESELGSLV